jgi:hypothetical protein
MPAYDPDAPETLTEYTELIAFADLRGGLEYETDYVNAAREFATATVCAVVIATLRFEGGTILADLIELDADGTAIQVWFAGTPLEAMAGGAGKWEPFHPSVDPDDFVRDQMRTIR